jgi:hypothetical protein
MILIIIIVIIVVGIFSYFIAKKLARLKEILRNRRIKKNAIKVLKGDLKNEYIDHDGIKREATKFIIKEEENKNRLIEFGKEDKIIEKKEERIPKENPKIEIEKKKRGRPKKSGRRKK